jgi:hypothetical protein
MSVIPAAQEVDTEGSQLETSYRKSTTPNLKNELKGKGLGEGGSSSGRVST